MSFKKVIPFVLTLTLFGASLACNFGAKPKETLTPVQTDACCTDTPIASETISEPSSPNEPPAPQTSGLASGWYPFTNANAVRDLVVYKGIVHAATLGGMITWRLDSGYSMRYTPLDGMVHVSTNSIVYCEIPEPRILVGTSSGISIYDPNSGLWKQELAFPPESQVDVSKINRLYCDQANNRLLIGYNGLGILDLKTDTFEHFTKEEGLTWENISDMAVVDKDIWIATGYNGVNKISDGKVTVYNKDNGLPDEIANAISVAKDGTLWIGTSSGIMSFKGNKWTMYGNETPAKLSAINEIEITPDGKIWVVTAPLGTGRLCQFNPQTGICDVDLSDADKQPIFALTLDEGGNPIYGTNKGVSVYKNGAVKPFKTEDQLASNFVDSFANAQDGKMWVGTDGGIHLLDPANPNETWQTFRRSDTPGLGGSWAGGIAVAPDGTVWAGIINGYASRYKNGTWTSYEDVQSYDSITIDAQSRAWFGHTRKGIIVLNADGSKALTLTTAEGLPSDSVYALLTDLSGRVWIGTDQGLAKYENGTLDVVFDKDTKEIPNKYIRALALDANGALIIGTFTGVARYDGQQTETLLDLLKDGYQKHRLTAIAIGQDSRLWVGTDRGLLYADNPGDWKMYTTKDGLLTDAIGILFVDQYGALWVGGGGNFDGGGMLQIVP